MALIRKKTQRSKSSSAPTSRRRTGRSTSNKKRAVRASVAKPKPVSSKEIKEVSAGGIVFRKQGRAIQFAVMKDSYDKWTFPKGRVEKGEDLEEAAARETLEELGLEEIRFLESLGTIDIWFRDRFEKGGALVHKDIHFFLFQTSEHARLHPDPKEHVKDAKWVPISQVMSISSYKDMEKILRLAIAFVKNGKS